MYISRLAFHTVPGKTHEVEQHLLQLREMVRKAGGTQPRVHAPILPRSGRRISCLSKTCRTWRLWRRNFRMSPRARNSVAGRSR